MAAWIIYFVKWSRISADQRYSEHWRPNLYRSMQMSEYWNYSPPAIVNAWYRSSWLYMTILWMCWHCTGTTINSLWMWHRKNSIWLVSFKQEEKRFWRQNPPVLSHNFYFISTINFLNIRISIYSITEFRIPCYVNLKKFNVHYESTNATLELIKKPRLYRQSLIVFAYSL